MNTPAFLREVVCNDLASVIMSYIDTPKHIHEIKYILVMRELILRRFWKPMIPDFWLCPGTNTLMLDEIVSYTQALKKSRIKGFLGGHPKLMVGFYNWTVPHPEFMG